AGDYMCTVSNVAGSAPSDSAHLTVNKASASVALGALVFDYNTAPHPTTATTTPPGLNVVITYDGAAAAPVNAGSHTVVATIDDANYAGSASGKLLINPAPAGIALGSLLRTFDGNPKPASVTTDPAGLGVFVTYDGAVTPPTNAGSYSVIAMIDNHNYFGR